MQRTIRSVTEITAYVKEKFEGDPYLQDVWLEGEISNWSCSRAGHCYFTVKDSGAAIRTVIWRSAAARLSFSPADGQAVLAHGHISVYEPQGQYQFYADTLQPIGRGALYAQFEALKACLNAEGLFDADRKRILPLFPRCIGIVTSPTGAALRDVLHVLERRWPIAQVLLSPTVVQGDSAPSQIVAALQELYDFDNVDLIIVTRGGGSIEDLWAFNDERVARKIAASPIPVVSGVGHQTDWTIADFIADVRAPTPSAAAEMVVPDQSDVCAQLAALSSILVGYAQRHVHSALQDLRVLQQSLLRLAPGILIERNRQRVDDLQQRIDQAWQHHTALSLERLSGLQHRLEGLNPRATLDRGYAIVHKGGGELVRSRAQVSSGDLLTVHVADGDFLARVEGR